VVNWHVERDETGLPSRLTWTGVTRCLHSRTRHGKPDIKERCVNISEFCVSCGERVAIVSWERTAWESERDKRPNESQIELFEGP